MAAWISLPGVATESGHVGKSKAVKMVLQCFLWVVFCSLFHLLNMSLEG